MEMSVFELLGVAGIAISMLAYVPQVVHLGREHCSAGISRRAWAMWLGSSVLIGATAHEAGARQPGSLRE
ncbi:MAG TPA: PQ-loop domain-containing transporter [Gaiella sp.]|nr:PQ-loop domain-containing transporter [Gaiella sp.]